MRRSRFLRNKKVFVFFIVLLFFVTIGFSYLNTSLSINGNLTVKGDAFTVSFDSHGGSVVNPVLLILNGTRGSLPETVKEGHDFLGWFTEENGGDQVTSYDDIESDITLHAHYLVHQHTLTVNNNGGSGCSNQTKNYGEVWDSCTPTRNGYTFSGWMPAFEGVSVSNDLSSTANWTTTNYTITWNLNGGSLSGQRTSYNITSTAYTLPNPSRSGYAFRGWYENGSFTGNAVTSIPAGSTGNKVFYAKWEAATVYISNNGSMPSVSVSVNVCSSGGANNCQSHVNFGSSTVSGKSAWYAEEPSSGDRMKVTIVIPASIPAGKTVYVVGYAGVGTGDIQAFLSNNASYSNGNSGLISYSVLGSSNIGASGNVNKGTGADFTLSVSSSSATSQIVLSWQASSSKGDRMYFFNIYYNN